MNELEVKNGYINGQKITGGVIPLEKFNDFFHNRNVNIDYYCMDLYGTGTGIYSQKSKNGISDK